MSSYSPADDDGQVASTPTPRSHMHRSFSHSSRTASDVPAHHNQGSSYFPHRQPSTGLRHSSSYHSMRRDARSASAGSGARGFRDDDLFSEQDEDEDELAERAARRGGKTAAVDEDDEDDDDDDDDEGGLGSDGEPEDPITLKERQSLINVEHPFGLPIWKPALYKKSRSVTRYADEALHSIPSAQAERHLLPGNIFWVAVFGWWLSITCFVASAVLYLVPQGGRRYSSLLYGLGWYLAWPFGKYVERDQKDEEVAAAEEEDADMSAHERSMSDDSTHTVRGGADDGSSTIRAAPSINVQPASPRHVQTLSWNPIDVPTEHTSLLQTISEIHAPSPSKSYGATPRPSSDDSIGITKVSGADVLGKVCFWLFLVCLIAPLMLFVCVICWGLVVTIPMAKLNWALIKHLFSRPDSIRFCAAPPAVVVADPPSLNASTSEASVPHFSVKHPRISAGQVGPSGSSKVLLCTYRAVGMQYYKYTVGGVNILFVNLMPIVFFVIFDGLVLLPMVERKEERHEHVPALLAAVASQGLIFFLSLLSVIPLSYFIGMAVASISAQSSIGMGAVINATFGSVIEIILYGIALSQNKGHLVEGSIVGSLLAGVLLMPGMSMVSSALRRKEQKFNAKSAGVTSMMLIMAIIGTLAPTLFYQTYGNFQLICKGCPSAPKPGETNMPWICDQCYYQHPDPVHDPFYQSTVKSLMYFCAVILVFSYLIGLWFSLRTHASQIWQNPQQLMQHDLPVHQRQSVYPRPSHSLNRRESHAANLDGRPDNARRPSSPALQRRVSHAMGPPTPGFTPVLESVDQTLKSDIPAMQLPEGMSREDFARLVAITSVSVNNLRQHQMPPPPSPAAHRVTVMEPEGGHGGHDAPSWSRKTSASVLMACTFLYAIIAEILVDVVDVILQGSGIDEKFLGVTLFALVPNTTEFMNAMSFALNGNIALSMEIGSAYALQVCLLQIPAMVAFSAWYAPDKMGEVAKTFTLIFPRWDVIAIILSMFLMTYTYIEAKSNYHRGSILILSYLVLLAGFYFAPATDELDVDGTHPSPNPSMSMLGTVWTEFSSLTGMQYARWYFLSWWPL